MAADPLPAAAGADGDDIVYPSAIPFLLVHLGCVGAIWSGVTWPAVALCVGLYWLRMFGVTAGYHRYFSHRSFATSRVFQFVLAFIAQSSAQRSVLWWAAKHRHHHLHYDTVRDVHSPRHTGFLYSHVGWIFARRHDATDLSRVADFARYPELAWLQRFETLPACILGVACFLIAGWPGLLVGFFWRTVLVYHGTFMINSLAHVRGSRRYVTGDDATNNLLRLLALLGIVRDLKAPPARVLSNEQQLGLRVVQRTAEQLAARFDPERIATAIAAALHAIDLSAVQKTLAEAHDRTVETLAGLNLPHLPSRADLLEQARAMFARTPSFDEIVDRGHALLFAAIGDHLLAAAPARR